MTVGRRPSDRLRRDNAAAAAAIFDQYLLTQIAGQPLRNQPCRKVIAGAGFGGDDADGFGREVLTVRNTKIASRNSEPNRPCDED